MGNVPRVKCMLKVPGSKRGTKLNQMVSFRGDGSSSQVVYLDPWGISGRLYLHWHPFLRVLESSRVSCSLCLGKSTSRVEMGAGI